MASLSDGRATPYAPPDHAEADFSDSDDAVGNDETTNTAATPPQDPPECPASSRNHDNLNSSDKEAIDDIRNDTDDLSTSDEEALASISDDQ